MQVFSSDPDKRYVGRPLLLFLELYVMACTGDMSDERKSDARFACKGFFNEDTPFWMDKLREKFGFSPKLDEHIRKMWVYETSKLKKSNAEITKAQLQPLLERFAKEIVDVNFAKSIQPNV